MQRLRLESFDIETESGPQPNPEFERGFREGHAAGLGAAQDMQMTLTSELVHNIGDLAFRYEEVRGDIIRALGPLFLALAEKVFPQCLADGFADQITSLLLKLATTKTTAPLRLSVHPNQREAAANAVASAAFDVSVCEDAALGMHVAVITHGLEEWQIDSDQLLEDIQEILDAARTIETRKISND